MTSAPTITASTADTTTPDASSSEGFGSVFQALLVLAPIALLAWPGPGAILKDDMVPHATGAGFVALALLPAAVVLLLRGAMPSVRALGFLLLPILIAVAWVGTDKSTDTFEAWRILITWITVLAAMLAGASLGPRGRATLARGTIAISIAFAGWAAFDGARAFTGTLGNTGNVSEAAIAGAVIGAAFALRAGVVWRALGVIAIGLFLVYVARVPVLAGAVCSAVGLAAIAWSTAKRASIESAATRASSTRLVAWSLPIFAVAALAIGALMRPASSAGDAHADGSAKSAQSSATAPNATAQNTASPSSATSAASNTTAASSISSSPMSATTSGGAVRLRVWRSSFKMLADHPLAGVGAGQFAACFPAYRDPREIEISTFDRRRAEETEVEHPHNDWLAPALEGGVFAGLAWIVFLAWTGVAAIQRLASRNYVDAALAAAALALLANAFLRGPLLQNPASSILAFAIFGTQLARDDAGQAKLARRVVVLGVVALLVVVAPRAQAFVRHGFALQRLAQHDIELRDAQHAVADALNACPDSVRARSESALIAEARHDGAVVVAAEWARVLDLRPLNVSALLQSGSLAAVQGEFDIARSTFERVLALDSKHPVALQNLATLELNHDQVVDGIALFDRMPATRKPTRAWLEELAARLALRGHEEAAEAVFAHADPALAKKTAEECYALSKEARKAQRDVLAEGWEARAQRLWAREHAAVGRFADAVRSYRQYVNTCSTLDEGVPTRARLELGAALEKSGKSEDARAMCAGITPTRADIAALPEWAATTLREAKLIVEAP